MQTHAMSVGADQATNYAAYAKEATRIDNEVQNLLEEMVTALQKGMAPGQLEAQAQRLAAQAARLAGDLDNVNELDAQEKTIMLESLSEQAERLMAAAPDAIIASEHERWSEELEAIRVHLHALRGSLSTLALPHVRGSQRTNHEKRVRALLTAAGLRLRRAHEGIHKKSHISAHPMYSKLSHLHQAMKGVSKHLDRQSAMKNRAQVQEQMATRQDQVDEAVGAMRHFLQRELNGRMYVDTHVIQMRSSLTGQVQEWPHDQVHSHALSNLLSGTELMPMLQKLASHKSSLAAQFECYSGANGLVVELTAGERSIVGDTVVYKPQVVRISV